MKGPLFKGVLFLLFVMGVVVVINKSMMAPGFCDDFSKDKQGTSRIDELSKKINIVLQSFTAMKHTLTTNNDFFNRVESKIDQLKGQILDKVEKTITEEESVRTEIYDLHLDLEDVKTLPMPESSTMSEKWIVVTSIFPPTEDIKKLAVIPGWKLVVVGDTKSPKTWKHPGVVFLSVDDQLQSGFETVRYLKYGVYQRKNIGYLYAIRHGAKYIYDTDDDNHPYKGEINFDEMKEPKNYLVYSGNQTFYNGFAHFGQSTLWPRGYPLNLLDKPPVRKYRMCRDVRPLVQQGVVDGDPDVDAIQRLTRKDRNSKFVVYFDISAPPVAFPKDSFCPYNSQNTFHHYDAFFSLLLPQTVTFRVNDIWRSLITQRLLWDVGGHLTYFPPNAYQDRTPHDFLQDFYEEDDLYRKVNSLSELLVKWQSKSKRILNRHFELIKDIYKEKILGALDVRLARAWARDLVRIGYTPPKMQDMKIKCNDTIVHFTPHEMPTIFSRIGQKTVNVINFAKRLNITKERDRIF